MLSPPRPAIKNFRPMLGICSYTVTDAPARASTSAAMSPPGPPPITAAEGLAAPEAAVATAGNSEFTALSLDRGSRVTTRTC
ncbi:unannotated protein [freshwater metagenome]|uniref:Unannotated protein n=1 Tax=freshwater metagenome TaxID=449393 RepID=A0A6J7NPF1_9ZZZZ